MCVRVYINKHRLLIAFRYFLVTLDWIAQESVSSLGLLSQK